MRCNISLKFRFLISHLEKFPANLVAISDDSGDRFDQDTITLEKQDTGTWNSNLLANYI